ncbi:MAG TPA: hypothetical protein VLT33_32175 [Labilithrix sp.]|nr:hypothetical protein [Labilithrix sp.]
MKLHAALGVVALGLAAGATGCYGHDGHGWGHYNDSEIVFGIAQTKGEGGKLTTAVGYEYLDVLDQGWHAVGLVSRGRTCWAERLDQRLGQPHVEGGVATFRGGLLPDNGIAVIANRAEELVLDGPAWQGTSDRLTFEAKGFAMPNIGPETILVPSIDLALLAPADPAAEVALDTSTNELEIGWTASDPSGPSEAVVASLVAVPEAAPDARGVELRCFFERSSGKGRFPQAIVTRFAALVGGAGAIKGKLHIATHRQLTIHADGGWTVYVVASVDQREQPFALAR